MQTTKKKPSVLFIVLGAVVSAYLGYLVNGAWRQGMEFNDFLEAFNRVLANPLADYYNAGTLKAVMVSLLIFAVAVIMYYTSQRNYMPGREFGTSELASVKQVNKLLCDKAEENNRILSQNVRMSLDTRHTGLNNNMLIIGGSGAGKTFYEVKPNLMQRNTSFIVTDPKGEILRSQGEMLKQNGYNVKVINLLEMDKSDCYNPFSYIREETDVIKLITNLMSNTTPKGAAPSDPFWEKAEGLFLQALFYYVWLEEKPEKRNFSTVLKLMGEAEVVEKGKPSPLDVRMKLLEETSMLGVNHPAVKQYNKCMRGAGDTVRSIIISANSRLATLENKQVLRMLSRDDLHLEELGIGVNGDGKTKTALFCVIPDSDKSYNYIIGLLYTQIFQELYYQADFNCGGRLPIHVTFMLDEFSNVALPDDYCSLLSTMRSREISSVIIIQNLAQIKALFKDTWETIPGNCDTLVYLGGNEQSTHEYISKLLGKQTIDKKTSGETKGRQGSSSRNYDVLGREIMMPDEVRKMDNKKCLIFIRGFNPILDNKYIPFAHPVFSQTADGGGEVFQYGRGLPGNITEPPFEILNEKSLAYFEKMKEQGEEVYIDSISYEDFMRLGKDGMKRRFISLDEQERRRKHNEQYAGKIVYQIPGEVLDGAEETGEDTGENGSVVQKPVSVPTGREDKEVEKPETGHGKKQLQGRDDNITFRLLHWNFTKEQKAEIKRALDARLPKDYILSYAYPANSVIKMMACRKQYESL
ncbi:MAG: type IV secretory system conjugative DNA transfer family protein [Clostridium sp.]|nr:type IV secretory system conjugative DNA transfer family protein [Clostridium sp.]